MKTSESIWLSNIIQLNQQYCNDVEKQDQQLS